MAESGHTILVSSGAEAFARDHGLRPCPNRDLIVARQRERRRSQRSSSDHSGRVPPGSTGRTVGAAALDVDGHLAVGTSTRGTFHKHPGRVGDSPLVGCGAYASDRTGAVSAAGRGEGADENRHLAYAYVASVTQDKIVSGVQVYSPVANEPAGGETRGG